jgi:DNA-binding response OmpR family regulator
VLLCPSRRVLLVEDEPLLARFCALALSMERYEVTWVASVTAAVGALRDALPDVVVSDVHLPDGRFFPLLGVLEECSATHRVPVIAMSGFADQEARASPQVDAFLAKPFSLDTLISAVANAVGQAIDLGGAEAPPRGEASAATSQHTRE